MNTIGTFTFTTGEPIRLQGFSHGAAVSLSLDKGIQKQIKDEIEGRLDVFSDDTSPYEDYSTYVEAGFLRGIKNTEAVNETVAALSALDRLDLDQDEEKIRASYVEILKNHSLAATFLSQTGIAVTIAKKPELAALDNPANETSILHDT